MHKGDRRKALLIRCITPVPNNPTRDTSREPGGVEEHPPEVDQAKQRLLLAKEKVEESIVSTATAKVLKETIESDGFKDNFTADQQAQLRGKLYKTLMGLRS